MILEVKTFPDNILRQKAQPVEKINDEITTLLDDMVDTMYDQNGVGLAAPQVGVSKRVIVVDISAGEEDGNLLKLVNPEIVESDGEQLGEEGCLSVPGEYEKVRRANNITLNAIGADGNEITLKAEGFLARAIQHEIDHLNGVLFIDKIPSFKRDTIKKSIKRRIASGDYVVTSD